MKSMTKLLKKCLWEVPVGGRMHIAQNGHIVDYVYVLCVMHPASLVPAPKLRTSDEDQV